MEDVRSEATDAETDTSKVSCVNCDSIFVTSLTMSRMSSFWPGVFRMFGVTAGTVCAGFGFVYIATTWDAVSAVCYFSSSV